MNVANKITLEIIIERIEKLQKRLADRDDPERRIQAAKDLLIEAWKKS